MHKGKKNIFFKNNSFSITAHSTPPANGGRTAKLEGVLQVVREHLLHPMMLCFVFLVFGSLGVPLRPALSALRRNPGYPSRNGSKKQTICEKMWKPQETKKLLSLRKLPAGWSATTPTGGATPSRCFRLNWSEEKVIMHHFVPVSLMGSVMVVTVSPTSLHAGNHTYLSRWA